MRIAQSDIMEFSALGIAAGGTGAVLGLLWSTGFDSTDIFAVAGAAIGAAITVVGALWVSERGERIAHRRETLILEEYCRPMLQRAGEIVVPMPHGGPWSMVFRHEIQDLYKLGLELPPLLQEALDQAQTLDLRERVKVRKAAEAVAGFLLFYDDCLGPSAPPDEPDDRSWVATIDILRKNLADLLDALGRS